MKEIEFKNLNSSWKFVGINFFILGLIFLILSHLADSDDWYFHIFFFSLSTLIVFKQFLKLIHLPKEIFQLKDSFKSQITKAKKHL